MLPVILAEEDATGNHFVWGGWKGEPHNLRKAEYDDVSSPPGKGKNALPSKSKRHTQFPNPSRVEFIQLFPHPPQLNSLITAVRRITGQKVQLALLERKKKPRCIND